MTLVHLVRHGQHNLGGGKLAGRSPGVGLTARGQAEIAAIGEWLAGGPAIAAIYASPLQRTRESAEILGQRLDLAVQFHDDLIELDFGDWTGKTFDSIRADPRWVLWNTQRSLATIPGGETMRQVQRRAVEALLGIVEQHPDDMVVLVSHGDVIRSLLVFALGMPLELLTRIDTIVGSVSSLRIDGGGARVMSLNYRPHAS